MTTGRQKVKYAALLALLPASAAQAQQTASATVTRTATRASEAATATRAPAVIAAEAPGFGQSLSLGFELDAVLLDYGLPSHPSTTGLTHVGAVGRARLIWRYDPRLSIEAGVLGRLPFAHDVAEEAGALPILAVTVQPFGPETSLRLGSLDPHHRYHPGLSDEPRFLYGLTTEASYNRSLLPEGRRALGGDPFLPGEHGGQLRTRVGPISGEAFLDWQLLETREHREKFAFGALLFLEQELFRASAQLRWVHYGGELYTKSDPIRFAGLDPVRQPISVALSGELGPLRLGPVALSVPLAYLRGRLIQRPGGAPAWHSGFELGLDLHAFELATFGYRAWLPAGGAGVLSEDGDPIYAGPRSHRLRAALASSHGAVRLEGRLDVAFPEGSRAVQYETVTVLRFTLEELLWSRVTDRDAARTLQ